METWEEKKKQTNQPNQNKAKQNKKQPPTPETLKTLSCLHLSVTGTCAAMGTKEHHSPAVPFTLHLCCKSMK